MFQIVEDPPQAQDTAMEAKKENLVSILPKQLIAENKLKVCIFPYFVLD